MASSHVNVLGNRSPSLAIAIAGLIARAGGATAQSVHGVTDTEIVIGANADLSGLAASG